MIRLPRPTFKTTEKSIEVCSDDFSCLSPGASHLKMYHQTPEFLNINIMLAPSP